MGQLSVRNDAMLWNTVDTLPVPGAANSHGAARWAADVLLPVQRCTAWHAAGAAVAEPVGHVESHQKDRQGRLSPGSLPGLLWRQNALTRAA